MFYQSKDNQFFLYQGDTIQVLRQLDQQADMIFADPPYFLSNGGKKIHARLYCARNRPPRFRK